MSGKKKSNEKVFNSEDELKNKAKSGDAEAKELCALLTELNIIDSDGRGIGQREDLSKAKNMYKDLADSGSPTAQLSYARLMMEEEEFIEAEEYFQMAEKQGYFRYKKMSKVFKQTQNTIDNTSGRKILVVDDNQTERDLLVGLIEKRNFDVFGVKHGGEALAFLRENKGVRLILLDINMPTMNGIDFLKKARSLDSYKNIPVIIVSSSTEKEHVIEAKKLGIGGWLLKPVEIPKLDKVLAFFK